MRGLALLGVVAALVPGSALAQPPHDVQRLIVATGDPVPGAPGHTLTGNGFSGPAVRDDGFVFFAVDAGSGSTLWLDDGVAPVLLSSAADLGIPRRITDDVDLADAGNGFVVTPRDSVLALADVGGARSIVELPVAGGTATVVAAVGTDGFTGLRTAPGFGQSRGLWADETRTFFLGSDAQGGGLFVDDAGVTTGILRVGDPVAGGGEVQEVYATELDGLGRMIAFVLVDHAPAPATSAILRYDTGWTTVLETEAEATDAFAFSSGQVLAVGRLGELYFVGEVYEPFDLDPSVFVTRDALLRVSSGDTPEVLLRQRDDWPDGALDRIAGFSLLHPVDDGGLLVVLDGIDQGGDGLFWTGPGTPAFQLFASNLDGHADVIDGLTVVAFRAIDTDREGRLLLEVTTAELGRIVYFSADPATSVADLRFMATTGQVTGTGDPHDVQFLTFSGPALSALTRRVCLTGSLDTGAFNGVLCNDTGTQGDARIAVTLDLDVTPPRPVLIGGVPSFVPAVDVLTALVGISASPGVWDVEVALSHVDEEDRPIVLDVVNAVDGSAFDGCEVGPYLVADVLVDCTNTTASLLDTELQLAIQILPDAGNPAGFRDAMTLSGHADGTLDDQGEVVTATRATLAPTGYALVGVTVTSDDEAAFHVRQDTGVSRSVVVYASVPLTADDQPAGCTPYVAPAGATEDVPAFECLISVPAAAEVVLWPEGACATGTAAVVWALPASTSTDRAVDPRLEDNVAIELCGGSGGEGGCCRTSDGDAAPLAAAALFLLLAFRRRRTDGPARR